LPLDAAVVLAALDHQRRVGTLRNSSTYQQDCVDPYEAFLADERIGWAEEPSGLELSWKRLAGTSKASPKLWMDAYLAAFAMSAGYQLVTTDKAFKHFKGLDLLVLSKS
jgi:predicted nucleic acid-binding protein